MRDSYMMIDFSKFQSKPSLIIQVIDNPSMINQLLNSGTLFEEDLLKLQSFGHIVRQDSYGFCKPNIRENTHFIELMKEFNDLYEHLKFLSELRKAILRHRILWYEYQELTKELSKKYDKENLEIDDEDGLKIELCISHFFSNLIWFREIIKNKIVQCEGKNITSKLVVRYAKFQLRYDDIRSRTIDYRHLSKFVAFFRNRIQHGGQMGYGYLKSNSNLHLTCMYDCLVNSKQYKESENLKEYFYYYFRDVSAVDFLRYYYENYNLSVLRSFKAEEISVMNFYLRWYKDDKDCSLDSVTYEELGYLLDNKEFVLYGYRKKKVDYTSCVFDLSLLIENAYYNYSELYESLYRELATIENKNIVRLLELNSQLKKNSLFVGGKPLSFEI